ncbi:hypothetical protein [Streptomyces sp. DT18]
MSELVVCAAGAALVVRLLRPATWSTCAPPRDPEHVRATLDRSGPGGAGRRG